MNLFEHINNKQVLGINRRNQLYIRPYNSSKAKRIADSKLLCKKIFAKHNIPTSETIKVIYSIEQLNMINWEILPKSMVIKPNEGTMGNGIIVFWGRKKGKLEWIKTNGQIMTVNDIKRHITYILEGRFSMGNKNDVCIIEERVINHELLKQYSYKGIPDIRVIVFNKIPVMAMIRLPTKKSEGKANVHAGAIAVGLDIATGITTTAIVNKKFSLIDYTQDVIEKMVDEPYLPLRGIKIPYWKKILEMAITAQIASGLGYIGVDIALDKTKGPLIFEINARPGLAIQVANQRGLADRLERIKGLKVKTVEQGIQIAQTLFGGEVEQEIENISGKQIISPLQKIRVDGRKKQVKTKKRKIYKTITLKARLKARVDTNSYYSYIDVETLTKLGYKELLASFEKITSDNENQLKDIGDQQLKEIQEEFVEVKDYEITKRKVEYTISPIVQLRCNIEEIDKEIQFRVRPINQIVYPVVLGRKDLKEFLIDPSRSIAK
ncbi:MAG TPA: sugar-transfer associated ATP-grasp domain-containing protein [Candidatus Dojkabacteria bacterium]|nr:sugar-transfer associated ATP-grasp domain-containing protein [Candidatus Dojkabacteria bacterium]HQF36037.1 sugar-transfer associated ATP-grasp domain-containing protein [Candidatus Dojkabacteria bacterium]